MKKEGVSHFSDLVHKFIQYLSLEKNASPHTLRAYLKDLEGFEGFLKGAGVCVSSGGEVEVRQVDRLAIRRYLTFLHRKNRKSSIARKLSSLRAFFKYLVREQDVLSNPPKMVSLPKVEKL